ncbi:glycoside hydrolase family 16 protein [Ekhidna sp.]
MKHTIVLILISLLLTSSCGEDGESNMVLLPSNLTVEISKNESGNVSFTATADDANFYQFDFGVGEGFVNDDDGKVSYTYLAEDTYTIKIRANTTSSNFIEISEDVVVEINSNVDNGGYETPLSYEGYDLVWNDEFEGNSLSSDWIHEIGTGSDGWGNNELQYYREENTQVDDGLLIIEARNEAFSGSQYTSSRIITENMQSFRYGRIDIRAILPEGQGIWPALWMLGANFRSIGWPNCGEIDIMEMIGGGGREDTVFGTLHWDNNGTYACTCGQDHEYTLSNGTFNDQFHVFSVIWNESSITWYVDDNQYTTVNFSSDMEEFTNDFFFIFNVAVGGNLPGSPNETTTFPQRMVVDYVRVFQSN